MNEFDKGLAQERLTANVEIGRMNIGDQLPHAMIRLFSDLAFKLVPLPQQQVELGFGRCRMHDLSQIRPTVRQYDF